MIVKKLYIKNYRCFGSDSTVIEFSDSGLNALIGPNNVGKSSVLKALEILLGDKWPFGRFTEEDFHNYNLQNEIILACQFFDPIRVQLSENNFIDAKGVAVGAKYLSTGYGDTSISVKYKLLQDDVDFDRLNFDTLDSFKSISAEIRNQLPIVITVPLAKLTTEQPTNRWSVLGRLLQRVDDNLRLDASRKKNFEEKIKDAVELLRTDEFKEIEDSIREFWNAMKPKNLTGIELKFLDYDPWRLYRQFKLTVMQNGKYVPLETLGEGVQRLAIIALYHTYLKRHERNEKAIFLIEEPEAYLHPQARKTLFYVLKEFVKNNTSAKSQIIYTTHSEDFIECGDFDNIVIFLRKTNFDAIEVRNIKKETMKKHTLALYPSTNEISDQHIYYNLIETISQGLKEALFTSKAVIVEGPSEVMLFKFFSDAEKEQIGIVSAGGKTNIPAIYSFLTAFGIPCLVVIDSNSNSRDNTKIVQMLTQENAVNPDDTKIEISLEEITNVQEGEIFNKGHLLVFGKNLETVLKNKIENWEELLKLIREKFNLPTDNDKPSPRDIYALALVYFNENCRDDDKLKKLIEKNKENIEELRNKLNEFIKQELKTPQLLTPKNDINKNN